MADKIEKVADMFGGLWMPKGEQHMREWMTKSKRAKKVEGKLTYQWWKQEAAKEVADQYMGDWRKGLFVDVGGHCAFWSMWWGRDMEAGAYAFEPIPYLRTIFEANMKLNGVGDYCLQPYGLGRAHEFREFRLDRANTGATRVYAPQEDRSAEIIPVEIRRLDDPLWDFEQWGTPTVLKIDCEGFEEKVLQGGVEFVTRWRPLVVIEQKFESRHFGLEKEGGVKLLQDLKYRMIRVLSGDHIMVPEERL